MTRCPKKVRAQRGIDLGWLREVLRAVKAAKMIAVQAGDAGAGGHEAGRLPQRCR